jgi:EAL domain-containing protein (putative c-di-GMP-specific phosphodiesterase class I)
MTNDSDFSPSPSSLQGQQFKPDRSGGEGLVIILDDDLDVANTVAASLGALGHRAVVTSSAPEFFDLIDRLSPSHLMIDLFMPEMDGLAVLRGLSSRTNARIIVTSGHDVRLLESMRQSAIALGLDVAGRLEKPFRLSRLRELMAIPSMNKPALCSSWDSSEENLSLQRILDGLDGGEFKLYLQVKISCTTQTIVGYEALVRWDHPEYGIIPPVHFVPKIEAAGMEHRLARYMIDLSMAYLAANEDASFHLAINVSLETLRSPPFRAMLAELRAQHDVAAKRIVLELTERGVGDLTSLDIETMTRIRLDGYLLSLDDFGVGNSSIQRLVQLPFSEIKIDRMFIRDVTTSDEARKLMMSMVAMGDAMNIPITAEGIENAETFEMLKSVGCTNAQGFLFGEPFPVPTTDTSPNDLNACR